MIGHPVENLRIVLTDGASHQVDSSELAFKLAAIYAFRQVSYILEVATLFLMNSGCNMNIKCSTIFLFLFQCYTSAKPVILEPVMKVELKFPTEFQGTVTGDMNK